MPPAKSQETWEATPASAFHCFLISFLEQAVSPTVRLWKARFSHHPFLDNKQLG